MAVHGQNTGLLLPTTVLGGGRAEPPGRPRRSRGALLLLCGLSPVPASRSRRERRRDALNDTNHLQIFVYCNEERRTCVVAARLDNLGKGASGAAVQNLNIALGLDEATGL